MTREQAITIVEAAIEDGERGENISEKALAIKGMTSPKIKNFLNSLCDNVGTYFEVGLFKGATFLSATEGNPHLYAVGCDNWSQFGGPKEEFYKNFGNARLPVGTTILDMDCFSPSLKTHIEQPIEVMFYDGDHSYDSQYKAFHLFTSLMADVGILIVDDWNKWGKRPTLEAINDSNVKLVKMWELDGGWWEGVGVLVLERSK